MPIYDRPTKDLMHEWADAHLTPGQIFDKSAPVEWFAQHYPKIKSNTVSMHVEGMATNNENIRRNHKGIRPGTRMDLFYKLGSKRFRLFDPAVDPTPFYLDDTKTASQTSPGSPEPEDPDDDPGFSSDTIMAARAFAYERDLQNYLVKNIETLEPGLKVYEDLEENLVGVEFDAGGRRIDILAVDREGALVVIELKVSKGHDRVVGQIARYMSWIEDHMSNGKPVRGIIVANNVDNDLKLAARQMRNIKLIEYEMRFEVHPVEF